MPNFLLEALVPETSLAYVHIACAGTRWHGVLILLDSKTSSKALVADLLHGVGKEFADFRVAVGRDGADLGDFLVRGDLLGILDEVGDRVLFGKWSGTEVKIDGQELLIMKESDIMGVLTDVPAAKKKAA